MLCWQVLVIITPQYVLRKGRYNFSTFVASFAFNFRRSLLFHLYLALLVSFVSLSAIRFPRPPHLPWLSCLRSSFNLSHVFCPPQLSHPLLAHPILTFRKS
jgi:hypothetical protein